MNYLLKRRQETLINTHEETNNYLSVLKDKEAHVLPVVHLILPEDWRRKVLDPHTSQLVAMDTVVLKPTLWEEK